MSVLRRVAESRSARAALLFVLSLAYLVHIFHIDDGRFFTHGLGDWIDPHFINFLLEQWTYSLVHLHDPSSPLMYFPARHTLGYSHGLVLFAPFYMLVRPFTNPIIANNIAIFLVMELGIACHYVLLRKFAHCSFVESTVLTALFVTSQNVVNGELSQWSQRASVFLIPPIALMALVAHRRRSRTLACVAGLLAGLLLTQDFPTAALAATIAALLVLPFVARVPALTKETKVAIALAIAAVVWAVIVTATGGFDVSLVGVRVASDSWHRPMTIVAALLLFVIVRSLRKVPADEHWYARALGGGALAGMAIFLAIYLPAYREHPAFPRQQIIERLQAASVHQLNAYNTLRPFLFAFAIALVALIPFLRTGRTTRLYVAWLLGVSLFVFIAPLRFGDFAVWLVLADVVPGFRALRDPERLIYLYELAIVCVAALMIRRHATNAPLRRAIVAVALLLMATMWNRDRLELNRPLAVFDQWVAPPIDVDPRCRSFFIKGASDAYMVRSDHMWSLYAVDSSFIAVKYSLPTLNGYSAWWPKEWNLANPQQPPYMAHVDDWIRRNDLHGVCALDIDARTMRLYHR